jgi:hypothetical protein
MEAILQEILNTLPDMTVDILVVISSLFAIAFIVLGLWYVMRTLGVVSPIMRNEEKE